MAEDLRKADPRPGFTGRRCAQRLPVKRTCRRKREPQTRSGCHVVRVDTFCGSCRKNRETSTHLASQGDLLMSYYRSRSRFSIDASDIGGSIAAIAMIGFFIACFGAWATHVVWIISKLAGDAGATVGQMVLGALGAFMPPVGIVHGFMIWFGIGF